MLDFIPEKLNKKQKTYYKKVLNDEIDRATSMYKGYGPEIAKIAKNYARRMRLKLKEIS